MATYGYVVDGKVREVITVADQAELEEKYHSGFVSECHLDVNDEIEQGWNFDGTDFSAPVPVAKTWDEVRAKQRNMIVEHQDKVEIHEREVAHNDTVEADYTMSVAKYQEFLTYFQVIRNNDEELHATPEDAIAALDALVPPSYPV